MYYVFINKKFYCAEENFEDVLEKIKHQKEGEGSIIKLKECGNLFKIFFQKIKKEIILKTN